MKKCLIKLLLFCIPTFYVCPKVIAQPTHAQKTTLKASKKLQTWENPLTSWSHVGKIKIDSVSAKPESHTLQLFFSTPLSYLPVREENSQLLRRSLQDALGRKYRDWTLEIYTDGHRLEELIPNSLRSTNTKDNSRVPAISKESRIPLVRKISGGIPFKGLYNNNIALWPSHGWYYESKLDRWEWQRARLFSTVEDIFTKSITIPLLVPMLENSGATVLIPEERDWQLKEVIVDKDRLSKGSMLEIPENLDYSETEAGFLMKDTLFSGENPFCLGHSLTFSTTQEDEVVVARPKLIPGEYAVYIAYRSFPNSSREVKVTVTNSAGTHEFLVNQRIGGGTWVYLGTFPFISGETGIFPEASVSVSLKGKPEEVISVDAFRFGGGMGNVARRPAAVMAQNVRSVDDTRGKATEMTVSPESFRWKTSGKSRFREGARYYLQYAGFPDSLVYNLNEGKNDYNDDYQSRGEWVNYLMGQPNGPQKNRNIKGLGIPVDLAFAFHTDAGITPDDSIIGTLAIYSTWADKGRFPEGSSRMASRDLADLIQTQITGDCRALFNPEWTRRGLWDKQYSEAWRPNVPVMLLELLSHQNLADMKFGLDPRFQFAVARSIYKGMLKFQASQEGRDFVVQPLPVDHFALRLLSDSAVQLTWQPVPDPLEPSATPEKYKVYTQIGKNGFDEGIVVNNNSVIVPLRLKNRAYSFKITALNAGGESFPSEILSAGIAEDAKGTVQIVNAFDRECGPALFDTGTIAGVEEWNDQGVPRYNNLGYVGQQYDFRRKEAWKDDDNPGWGSSYGDRENEPIPGNLFNYSTIHGNAWLSAGYSYVSTSDEAFEKTGTEALGYAIYDILAGEEKATPGLKNPEEKEFVLYTPAFRNKLTEITAAGANLLLSGAYVGTELTESKDTLSGKFASETLHFIHRTSHAVKNGGFTSTDYGRQWFALKGNFNTGIHPEMYTVEAPDGIEPAGKGAFTAFRYGENNVSAGVAYRGKYKVLALGFPLETITEGQTLNSLVKQIADFFNP